MAKHSKSKDESSDDSLYNSSEGEQINDQVNEEVEEEDEEELEAVARPVDSDEDDAVGSGDDQEDDDNNNEDSFVGDAKANPPKEADLEMGRLPRSNSDMGMEAFNKQIQEVEKQVDKLSVLLGKLKPWLK